jgi:hypothetical protein
LHFRVEGPVVSQLQEAFVNDWAFTTKEILDGEIWFPELKESGNVIARAITDGPDADFENARWTLLAALAEAQTSVKILTPYFLPDNALVTALNLAALRGVRVDIILPAKNNLPPVHWASRALWWQVLQRLPHLAHVAAVRPFQADDRGRPLGSARLGLGTRAQPAPEFRDERRGVPAEFADEMELGPPGEKLHGAHEVTWLKGSRTVPRKIARRDCALVLAVFVKKIFTQPLPLPFALLKRTLIGCKIYSQISIRCNLSMP